jgi:hypothetical protein
VKKKPVKLLWTGGWDSTFRLLHVTIGEGRIVQPFYLIDRQRRSAGQEIRVMEQIKDRLFSEYHQVSQLILPTIYTEVNHIQQNDTITEAYQRVKVHSGIGEQYEWLARWCARHGLEDIELCIHRDDKAHRAIKPYIAESNDGDKVTYVFDSAFNTIDEFLLFRYFRFPSFDMSKLDMKRIMILQGLESYMDMTWFCYSPTSAATPCGICNPCVYTIEEGLGYRIPLFSRGKYYMQQFFVGTVKRRSPFFYSVGRIIARAAGWVR